MKKQQKNLILEAAAKEVERQTEDIASRQPRFQNATQAFGAVLSWTRMAEIEQVPYSSNSMARDAWLRNFWKLEPRLAGIVNDVTLIDSNRGWSIVGGRNQVRRYTDVLHAADGGAGWRTHSRKLSLSYWCTDMGAVEELGREGENGPLRGLYHVDSARCRLTGEIDRPLAYYPAMGGQQIWPAGSFFRICSMPSDDEMFYELGYCAISRCVELARIMYAVMMHDQEQLGARAPKGLLLLQNISEEQWNQSLSARDEALAGLERMYYGGVQVLASTGVDQIDAKLIALSQLPVGFDAQVFMNLTMYGYALCFGYDPREFWPVSGGQLGTALETEAQHNKATSKGGMEFVLAYQEHLQDEFPETLQFEFEQRDDQGELQTATVQQAKLNVISAAYNAGLVQGVPLISREEARVLLAEAGLIPEEWTAVEEETEATDTEAVDTEEEDNVPEEGEQPEAEPTEEKPEPEPAERWLALERVQRAMARFPKEPIVRYHWPSKDLTVLWQPRSTPKFHPVVKRADEGILYKGRGITITEEDVDRAVLEAKRRVGDELAQLLEAPTVPFEQVDRGGPGSGNFGHKGIKGQVGGSVPSGAGGGGGSPSKKVSAIADKYGAIIKETEPEYKKARAEHNAAFSAYMKSPRGSAERDELKAKLDKADEKYNALSDKYHGAMKAMNDEAAEAIRLELGNNSHPRVEGLSGLDAHQQQVVKEGVAELGRYLPPEIGDRMRLSVHDTPNGREKCMLEDGTQYGSDAVVGIYLDKSSTKALFLHEAGHAAQYYSKDLDNRATEFFKKRTAGEQLVSINDAYKEKYGGGGSFRDNERCYKDKFIDPYMGKHYGSEKDVGGQNEIISMGLQFLHQAPTLFAQQDPDYFDFMMDVLKGAK